MKNKPTYNEDQKNSRKPKIAVSGQSCVCVVLGLLGSVLFFDQVLDAKKGVRKLIVPGGATSARV